MITNFAYKTNKGFIEVNERKNISVASIKEGFRLIKNNKSFPRKLNILIDARETKLDFDIKNVQEIVTESSEAVRSFKMFKEAIILNRPKDTALATLISLGIKQINYRLGVFSTREAAINWLTTN
ncbi:MAG: hypothetical protein PF541_17225 [Prolixibacteraceae bacterium]|jgi:hypothetical protein|nr:hypothetical protein [Prolixibacteraceae bacterium]